MSSIKLDEHEKDLIARLKDYPEYAAVFLEEVSTRPLQIQFYILRRLMGWTQERLARELGLKQTHISRLEKVGSNHRAELYSRAAAKFGARLAFIPAGMKIVPIKEFPGKTHSLAAERGRPYLTKRKAKKSKGPAR